MVSMAGSRLTCVLLLCGECVVVCTMMKKVGMAMLLMKAVCSAGLAAPKAVCAATAESISPVPSANNTATPPP